VDGQNLFHAAREAFGYTYPNYDISALSRQVCAGQGWELSQVCFYNKTDWIRIDRRSTTSALIGGTTEESGRDRSMVADELARPVSPYGSEPRGKSGSPPYKGTDTGSVGVASDRTGGRPAAPRITRGVATNWNRAPHHRSHANVEVAARVLSRYRTADRI